MLRVVKGIAACVWLAVPQTTEWQSIGNQIDGAMILALADFVNVLRIFFAMLQRDCAHGVALML